MNPVLTAFGLTLFAGMATGIGSVIAFTAKRTNYRFLSVATGFSAGVMLYIAFVEIFHKGADAIAETYGAVKGDWINTAAFFGGVLLIGLIDNLIPSAENPHETHEAEELRSLHERTVKAGNAATSSANAPETGSDDHSHNNRKLMRMGLFTALAITIHNFPEGLATFLAALKDPKLGVAIALAVALHNIPEGISVSVPIFYATGNRRKAFLYSVLSGLAEPVGAVVAYVALRFLVGDPNGVIPPHVMGILFGMVAGIMVYISLDELLPTSRAYGKDHDSILGLVAGMFVMAISMLLLG
jgi:ZIP family zinc transporter